MASRGSGYGGNGGSYVYHAEDSSRLNRDRDPTRNRAREYNQPQDNYPFFLPGEGIARQVIQTDLPRYLGNNAHCRPGVNREGREGYWYRGYRMLTDPQILSLKEDSAKWNNERQQFANRNGGRDGPEYITSHTFNRSYRDNPDGLYPEGTSSFGPAVQLPPPPPEVALEQQSSNQDPRYLYMPPPDNRPWYDNWTGKYVPPFREPGAASPEPIPPARPGAQIPRHVEPENTGVPGPEDGGPPNPLDPITNQPMQGHWIRRGTEWLFLAGPRQARAATLYGRNDVEERGELD